MEVAIMIEGQDGLTWERWQRIARTVEDAGYVGLYRSDHFTNAGPPDIDSLEAWVSLAWLASHTERIEFGTLVSPFSFRDPVFLARMAYQIDDLSGGRLTFGVGAGWQVREHSMFGYDLLDIPERFIRFEEGLQVITGLLKQEAPFSFEGAFYRLQEARLLPRPARPSGPPILIGGNGPQRTLPLVAHYADEWNGVLINKDTYAERNALLNELLDAEGRHPADVRRSLMTQVIFGRDEAELKGKLAKASQSKAQLQERGLIVGTPSEIVDQLGALEEAGVQRVMLQWLAQEDTDGIAALAAGVLGQV